MRNALYSLEDYFEALAKQRLGRMTRPRSCWQASSAPLWAMPSERSY